jgi:2-keto-3-deoxy-L-rhamnonate aldolase RhmA
VPRIFALAGFDFVFIDTEHTAFTLETVADMIASARRADIVPIVRVPQAEQVWIAKALDVGAQGVIVPRVNTPQQVENLVSWMHFPPRGIRGYASTHHQTDDQPVDPASFIAAADEHTMLVIQIERRESLDNLDAMLSIPGVDVACLGCMDLSVDLGVPGRLDHPTMVAGIDKVIDACKRNNLAAGIIHPDMKVVTHWIGRGMRFVSYGTEAILLRNAADEAVRQLRSLTT